MVTLEKQLRELHDAAYNLKPFWIIEKKRRHETALTRLVETASRRFAAHGISRSPGKSSSALDAFLLNLDPGAAIRMSAMEPPSRKNEDLQYSGLHVYINTLTNEEVVKWELPMTSRSIRHDVIERFEIYSPDQLDFATELVANAKAISKEAYLGILKIEWLPSTP